MDCFASLAMTGMAFPGNRVARAGPICEFPAMKATAKISIRSTTIAARVDAIDWAQATADLDAQGCAVLKELLSPQECARAGRALSR